MIARRFHLQTLLTIIIAVLFSWCVDDGTVRADCSVAPSVGVSVAPQPNGIPVITVTYSFPDTTDPIQRKVELRIYNSAGLMGHVTSFNPADASGMRVIHHEMFCAPSHTYRYEAEAIACGRRDNITASASYAHNVKPTVGASYNGPDDQGHGTLIANFTFPNTSDSSQRHLEHRVYDGPGPDNFGTAGSTRPVDREGTWTRAHAMTCRTGTFDHVVIATTCSGETARAQDTVVVNTKPTVSVSVGPIQDNGDVMLTIPFGFPNTDAAAQRTVTARVEEVGAGPDGFGTAGTIHPDEQYGTWKKGVNRACDMRNLNAWVIATSCTGEFAEQKQPLPKPEKPRITSVALSKVKGQPRVIRAKIDYEMGKGVNPPWHISLELLPGKTADGKSYTGSQLFKREVGPRKGSLTETFVVPVGARLVNVVATAHTCVARANKDASILCDPCEGATADPVFLSSGNVAVVDEDPLPPVASQRLVRTYNSDEEVVALFGRGWTTILDQRLSVAADGAEQIVSVVSARNESLIFRGSGSSFRQTWPTSRVARDTLTFDATTNTYTQRAAGSQNVSVFRADGTLIALRDLGTGREATIAYDASGLPTSITDSWSGTSWQVTMDAANRRVTSIAVNGRSDLVWSYAYDGSGNLITVTAPGLGTWRTYEYIANRLTASRDALGHLIESHTYDADGYGVSSTGPTDEISLIEYELPGTIADERVTRITYKTGAVATFALRPVGSGYRVVQASGGCGACGGGDDATFVYDDEGRVVREQSADAYITERTYGVARVSEERFLRPASCDPAADAGRCRMNMDALALAVLQPTAVTTRTTFSYSDLRWPDLLTGIETPSVLAPESRQRVNYSFHPRTAALVSTSRGWTGGEEDPGSERTTSNTFYGDTKPCDPSGDEACPSDGTTNALSPAFAPGGAFSAAWLSLPQPSGFRKSVDEPRTDVQDVTSFVYYPIDAAVPALLRGQLAARRNAAGHIVRYESYDIHGNATRVVDANGVVTESTYDELGRLTVSRVKALAECDPERDPLCDVDFVTTRTYDGAGPLAREEQPGGGVSAYTYDVRGRVRTISRGPSRTDLRERIEYDHDPLTGKKSSERTLSFENGGWVEKRRQSYTYDADARLVTVTHADGTAVHYAHDSMDRIETVRDENHTTPNTRYTYDPAGRLSVLTQTLAEAAGGAIATRYAYDLHGNLISVADPNGNVTTYVYDDFGDMLRQSSPVTGVTTYTYDEAANLRSTTDARGVTTTRTYDALGRITASLAAMGASSEEVRWTYDAAPFGRGRVATMTDPTGSTAYAYERRGLLVSETKTIGGTTYATRYGLDADGNRSAVVYPSGASVSHTFDYAGRPLTASRGGSSLVSSATYLPFGPLTEMVLGNGAVKRMTYDHRYRPVTNSLTTNDRPLASYSYSHDAVGNVTSIRDEIDPSWTRDFGYDDLNRLKSANTIEAFWGAASYSYDSMGNLLNATLARADRSFQYAGVTPKLSSVTESGHRRDVQYDAVGNELAAGTTTFEYTLRNHLAQQVASVRRVGRDGEIIDEPQPAIRYAYDGRGVRTIISRPSGIASLTAPSTTTGGTTVRGELALTSAAPSGGAVVALTSSNPAASVPTSVTVAAGQTAATFDIATQVVTTEQRAILTAAYAGSSRSTTIAIVPGSRLDEVSVAPQSIVGGESARGTVTLSTASDREASVSLESSNEAARVPEGVVVPAGQRSVDFAVRTAPVAARTAARITAVAGGEAREALIAVLPPSVVALTFTPAVLHGGTATTGSVTLNGQAPSGGLEVALTAAREQLSVPPTLTIAGGQRSASFSAPVIPVEVETVVAVTAAAADSSVSGQVTVTPPDLTEISVSPGNTVGGEIIVARIQLDAPAAPEGARLQVTSSHPDVVPAPAAALIPAGATSHDLRIATNGVTVATPVVLSATRAGITRSATVMIEPPPVTIASLVIDPTSLVGTNSAVGTITMTNAAPAEGVEVQLATDTPAIATVPPSVRVPAGASQVSFVVATSLVTATSPVAITAAHAATQKSVTISVTPPAGNYIADLRVTPPFVVGGSATQGSVTLATPVSESGGSSVMLTSSAPAVVVVPESVKVNNNSSSATFGITTMPLSAPLEVTVTATFGGVVQRATMIVTPENAIAIASLTVTPDRLTGGGTATGTVTLTGAAPFGGAAVTIDARRRNIVSMPGTVTVPEGATRATFPIRTDVVHGSKDRPLEIVATYNGVSATATLTVTPPVTASVLHKPLAVCASVAIDPCLTAAALAAPVIATTTTTYERQYALYTPELSLLAETAPAITGAPPIAYEYIWFGREPLAQVTTATGDTHWYFNDHLGTPILQTDATARVVWQAEYEPYGNVYAFRRGESKHQPLRFPGQEAGAGSEISYNVFRWYRSGWGRYTQADPFELAGGINLFAYVLGNPIRYTDPLGLDTVGCDSFNWRAETPCQLECCARHDKCFDDNNCSSGSWPGATPNCGCDKAPGCQKCNSDARQCILGKCNRFADPNSADNPNEPNFYCGKQHRFVRIPGDFPNRKAAEKACEYDYSKDCKTPLPQPKHKKPWWKRIYP